MYSSICITVEIKINFHKCLLVNKLSDYLLQCFFFNKFWFLLFFVNASKYVDHTLLIKILYFVCFLRVV